MVLATPIAVLVAHEEDAIAQKVDVVVSMATATVRTVTTTSRARPFEPTQ